MPHERWPVVGVRSAGRPLLVEAPPGLVTWWPRIAPRLPGVGGGMALEPTTPPDGGAVVRMPGGLGREDTRRWLGAQLHRLHLENDTVCVHAVCAGPPGGGGGAVVLLGGHGAGKTLTAMALTGAGWEVLAGDVALLECASAPPDVVGGTSAFIVRREPTERWFPGLPLPAGEDRLDLAACLPGRGQGGEAGRRVPVGRAVLVDVDGAPDGHRRARVEPVDRHTAAGVWLRASGHLLDRVTDSSEELVLREVEDAAAYRRRLRLVRGLAKEVPMSAAWGSPHAIAGHVRALVAGGRMPAPMGGAR